MVQKVELIVGMLFDTRRNSNLASKVYFLFNLLKPFYPYRGYFYNSQDFSISLQQTFPSKSRTGNTCSQIEIESSYREEENRLKSHLIYAKVSIFGCIELSNLQELNLNWVNGLNILRQQGRSLRKQIIVSYREIYLKVINQI